MTMRQRCKAARTNPSKTPRDPQDLQRSIESLRDYRRQRFMSRVLPTRSVRVEEAA